MLVTKITPTGGRMFCQQCGTKQEVGAKFCPGCGKPHASEVLHGNPPTPEPQPLQEKVFLNEGGILVSDAVFRTVTGASYPIRNISSVSVETKKPSGFLVFLAGLVMLFGLFLMAVSVGVGFTVILISIPFWYLGTNTSHELRIGAGGVLQTAITSKNSGELNGVASAINDSILYLQRVR
jgi:Family of unknown function (DUF6232)